MSRIIRFDPDNNNWPWYREMRNIDKWEILETSLPRFGETSLPRFGETSLPRYPSGGNFFAEVPFWGKLLCRGLGKHIDKKNNMVLYRPYVYYMSFYYVNDTGFKYVNDIGLICVLLC